MPRTKANIVLILADDMGYGDFGVFNEGLTCTPAIDSVIAGGVCFTQHYSASPVCAPARAGLLTGRYPHRSGVIDTYEVLGLDRMALDAVTIGDILSSQGYATGLVGKWHCGAFDMRYHPTRRGFREFIGFSGGWSDYYQWVIEENGAERSGDGSYLTDRLADAAVQFIGRHKSEPFFLHVAFNAPHFPIQAPEEEMAPFRDNQSLTTGVRTLYAMIRRMDRGIERILHELSASGLEENTIVLITSDNGPDFGGKGDGALARFNCNYRGSKTYVYEGGIRVPAVLRWPAGIERRDQCDDLVMFYDWLPTLLAAAGVPVPGELALDGMSILPVLQGRHGSGNARKTFWQWNRFHPDVRTNAAMRDGAWKLVQPAVEATMPSHDPTNVTSMDAYQKYHKHEVRNIRPEELPGPVAFEAEKPKLFNLANDPSEERDLAAERPQQVNAMLAELTKWFETVRPGNTPGPNLKSHNEA